MASTSSGVKITQNVNDTDIILYQGKTVTFEIVYNDVNGDPVDVTGYLARFQARETVASATKLIDWDQASEITVGTTDGTFTFQVPAADTAAIAAFRGVYDMEIQSPAGDVDLVISGKITVLAEVTR